MIIYCKAAFDKLFFKRLERAIKERKTKLILELFDNIDRHACYAAQLCDILIIYISAATAEEGRKAMFCVNCGSELKEGAMFCPDCGAPAGAAPAADELPGDQVKLCADGKYRWVYEMSLFKNPTVFVLIWKIFFFIFLGIFAIMMIVDAAEWSDFFPDRFLNSLKIMGYFTVGMTAVVGISYLIYAAIMGGKYIVEFEMDDEGVNHRQIASQSRKAKKLGEAVAVAGALSGNLTMTAAGINSQRTEMYSEFSKVRKLKAYPRRGVIKLNAPFNHNQVYASREDFEFVREYIVSRCVNLKK